MVEAVRTKLPSVLSVQVGRIAPLGPLGEPSAFVKTTVSGPVQLAELGIEGDEQADLSVHGGPDKAVYFYPAENYALWMQDVPQHERLLVPGGFGENVTINGLNEESVSIGDLFRIGTAEVQVTQPRQPCFKLGLRFDDSSLGRIMMQTRRTGWYVRVVTPGVLQAGDAIEVLKRSNPGWTIARFAEFIRDKRVVKEELDELLTLEGLADGWKQRIARGRASLG